MELLRELLLTAAASLLVAFLLARLFGAAAATNDAAGRGPGPAVVIVEEKEEEEEEERIIEVDEVKVNEARAVVAAMEGWVEVGKPNRLPEEEVAPGKAAARELSLGAVSVEREEEEGQVGEERRDLTAAAETVVVEVKPRELGVEAAPCEVLDVDVAVEKQMVQDVGVERHDLVAKVAPSEEVLGVGLEKEGVPVVEAAEVRELRLVALPAPAEVVDAGLEGRDQSIEARPHEFASETVPVEVPVEGRAQSIDVVSEEQEEQAIEEKQHELSPEAAPRMIVDAALTEEEKLKEEEPVEEAVDVHEEVQRKEEAECEAHPVDRQEGLVSQGELVVRKTEHVEVIHESSSSEEVVAELPEEEATLQGVTADDSGADMEFGEWEGIERSDVEKRFGEAAAFATSDAGTSALSKLDSGVQLQLQGLLKVAIDGPCYDSTQPLTLRPSSRAKWVAWQKLGNMHPEIAMEKYMNLLSETIPGWTGDSTLDTEKHEAGGDSGGTVLTISHTSDQLTNQGNEDSTEMEESHPASSPNPEKGRSSDIPAE